MVLEAKLCAEENFTLDAAGKWLAVGKIFKDRILKLFVYRLI